MSDEILKQVVDEFAKIGSVKAIVLSGSRTAKQNDELSDYDIYIYTDREIDVNFRRALAEKYAVSAEVNNQYWETGDEWKMTGPGFDFMYRCPNWISEMVENVVVKHYSSLGYTTCFLHNVKTAEVLYEKGGWFTKLQNKIPDVYPEELKLNIIKKNLPLLMDKASASYLEQIENAVKRNDVVSVNHRITAFLSSYFDILFAVNGVYHPGEKRLISFSKNNLKLLPENFESDLTELFSAQNEKKVEILCNMVNQLKKILPEKLN